MVNFHPLTISPQNAAFLNEINKSKSEMMRSLIFSFALLFCSFAAFSQNENPKRQSSLKIYNLTTVERDYSPQFFDSLGNEYRDNFYNIQLLHPTIAYQWFNAKGNAHEIELTSLRMSTSESNRWAFYSRNQSNLTAAQDLQASAMISLRYEYILFLKRETDPKLMPSLGLGVNPYYMLDIFRSTVTTVFPERFQAVGIRFFAIPRLNYSLSDRLYLDLNFPISLYDAKLVTSKSENPTIPNNERKRSSVEVESFAPLFSARLGIGIRL